MTQNDLRSKEFEGSIWKQKFHKLKLFIISNNFVLYINWSSIRIGEAGVFYTRKVPLRRLFGTSFFIRSSSTTSKTFYYSLGLFFFSIQPILTINKMFSVNSHAWIIKQCVRQLPICLNKWNFPQVFTNVTSLEDK